MARQKARFRLLGGRRASGDRALPGPWHALAREALGLGLLALGLLSGLALGSYDARDPIFVWEPVANAAGVAGALIAHSLLTTFGPLSAGVPVAVALFFGVQLLARGRFRFTPRFWAGALLLFVALATLPALLGLLAPGRFVWGDVGHLGRALARVERVLLSGPGALGLNALLLLVGVLGLFGVSPGAALMVFARALKATARALLAAVMQLFATAQRGFRALQAAPARLHGAFVIWREQRARRESHAAAATLHEPVLPEGGSEGGDARSAGETAAPTGDAAPQAIEKTEKGLRPQRNPPPAIVEHPRAAREAPEQDRFTFSEETSTGPYLPPDVATIFQESAQDSARRYDRDSLIMNSRILEKKLADFGVSGRVAAVHPGPVITMYEFEPAPGVKVNRITNLTDDLALALRALSIRIIAPIPGKSVVGIEVPNPDREMVYIRDLLEAKGYRSNTSKLTLALGKDIFGNPVEADLAKMPHLLVAGATGTGKSVFLNSLLCSILCRATPDEVKLLLVDPKLLELSIYEGIPHLIADVVTDPKHAAAALQGVASKMEERYQRMAALGVRNISQYNSHVDEALAEGEKTFFLRPKPGETQGEEVEYARLSYVVVVIDELADLMLVSKRAVEESLQRLAQMARAAGIHLVLATQRPSVDVLTGIIKANFPSRISFQVSSRADSQTILDQSGADALLGMGDMLFLPPGTSKLQRLHGSFVTEREVAELVRYLRTQGQPNFDETLSQLPMEDGDARSAPDDEEVDEHYDLAVQIVTETRNASISYIQRRLKVGYNRAARMIERMEHEGVVSPQIGAKRREVLVRAISEDGDVE